MLRPLNNYVIIKPIVEEQKTDSGIIIPDKAKERPQQGEVIAVGSGNPDNDNIKVGAKVVYKKWDCYDIKHEGNMYLIIKAENILAILN